MQHEAPPEVLDLAAACVRYVHKTLQIELDFTPETLPLLDHYLRGLRDDDAEEVVALLAPAAGAYFGEVVRRHQGSVRWHTTGQEYAGYRLEFEGCFLYFNPIGQALEAIRGEAVPGYHSHFGVRADDARAVKAALERLGDVRDDDYYRLSIRYEVIEQLVVTLVAEALSRGEQDRPYSAADYATLIAEVEAAERQGGPDN